MAYQHLSLAQARRVAIDATGLAQPPSSQPGDTASGRSVMAAARRLGVVQIDSVNVFARAHYMPLFSRLGNYDPALLDAAAARPKSGLFEYWAHEAAFVPVEAWPIWNTRMRARRERVDEWTKWAEANNDLVTWLLDYVRDHRRTTASAIEHERNKRKGNWWGWSDVKTGLEWLFRIGELTSDGRKGFQRQYTLPERVIPADLLTTRMTRDEAAEQLIRLAVANLGVFTAGDAADYFRMRIQSVIPILAKLEVQGVIAPVAVEGWRDNAWLHTAQRVPRSTRAQALVSPFDPIVWHRPRTHRLFDFHYRIEIYTPQPKRIYGYYTLPFVWGDNVVGRLDLKADRAAGVLRVPAAWAELDAPIDTADAMAASLVQAAKWQGLNGIEIGERGNLAAALTAAVASA